MAPFAERRSPPVAPAGHSEQEDHSRRAGRSTDPAINAYARLRLKRLLESGGNQNDLAEKLGISPSNVSRLATEGKGVGWKLARRLANVLGLTLGDFCTAADAYWESQQVKGGVERLSRHPRWAELSQRLVREYDVSLTTLTEASELRADMSKPLTFDRLVQLVEAISGERLKPARRRPRK